MNIPRTFEDIKRMQEKRLNQNPNCHTINIWSMT